MGSFLYTDEKLETIQNRLLEIDVSLTKDELRVVAVRASLNENRFDGDRDILLTENRNILKNRRALESEVVDYRDVRLNIMSLEEAAEFLGLFMRYRDEYRYFPKTEKDIGYSEGFELTHWCWCLSDLIVSHTTNIDGISTRLENLIVGLDELGYQYYRGTGNHTNIYTRYHFDHCVSLITGIFDSLALHTRDKYGIELRDDKTNIRTGEPLFKELRKKNEKLWEYIESNHPFVELIYVIRPLVIHKEGVMLRGPGYRYSEGDQYKNWESHVINMGELREKPRTDFSKYYEQLDDELLNYDPITKWGLICTNDTANRLPETTQDIEPYQFMKTAIRRLIKYTDKYLKILGEENRQEMLSNQYPDRYTHLMNIKQYMMTPLL